MYWNDFKYIGMWRKWWYVLECDRMFWSVVDSDGKYVYVLFHTFRQYPLHSNIIIFQIISTHCATISITPQNILPHSNTYQHFRYIPTYFKSFQHFPPHSTIFQHIPPNFKTFQHIPLFSKTFRHIWSLSARLHHYPPHSKNILTHCTTYHHPYIPPFATILVKWVGMLPTHTTTSVTFQEYSDTLHHFPHISPFSPDFTPYATFQNISLHYTTYATFQNILPNSKKLRHFSIDSKAFRHIRSFFSALEHYTPHFKTCRLLSATF